MAKPNCSLGVVTRVCASGAVMTAATRAASTANLFMRRSIPSVYHVPMRTVADALGGSVLLAIVMTFGDFVWSAMHLPHRVAYGIAHGAVMCGCLGLVIGWRARRLAAGAMAGPLIGVIAALS